MNKLTMASDTILLNDLFPIFLDKNSLGLHSQRKHIGMPHAILRFEIVFIEKIIVRYMTIITVSYLPV